MTLTHIIIWYIKLWVLYVPHWRMHQMKINIFAGLTDWLLSVCTVSKIFSHVAPTTKSLDVPLLSITTVLSLFSHNSYGNDHYWRSELIQHSVQGATRFLRYQSWRYSHYLKSLYFSKLCNRQVKTYYSHFIHELIYLSWNISLWT